MLRDRLKYLSQVYRERTGESDVEDDEVSTSSKPSVSSKPSISSKADSTKPAAAKKKAAAAPKKKAAPKSSATNSKKRKKPDAGEDVPLDPETGEPIDYDPADFASDQEPASDDDFEVGTNRQSIQGCFVFDLACSRKRRRERRPRSKEYIKCCI